jgi:leucyl/phenylalanyl-tRNA---protein transferase
VPRTSPPSLAPPVVLDKPHARFPDPRRADADGLVALGGALSVANLLNAYRHGIFPWSAAPVTWWSPDPRAILELDRLHVSHSLRRTLKSGRFEVTRDRDFRGVIRSCAAPGPGRHQSWITSDFVRAYGELHRRGHAHSVECWQDGRLAGGIYGVSIGGLFAGESMFHRVSDASKVALVSLVEHLRTRGYQLFDIQMLTPITTQMGGIEIPRDEYLRRLADALRRQCRFEDAPDVVPGISRC